MITMNSVHDYANKLKEEADSLISNSMSQLKPKNTVLFNDNDEVTESLRNAVSLIAKAVTSTLGPKGQNVIFDLDGIPVNTKDGVTVCKQLLPVQDPIANMAIQLVIQAAENTAYLAGDGTTTTVALTDSLVDQFATKSKLSKPELRKQIEKALAFAINELKQHTKKINSHNGYKYIRNIAYTSANNDAVIADKIVNVYKKLTDWSTEINFITTTDESDRVELVPGYRFNHRSPSVKDKKIIVDNPYIVLCNFKITDWNSLLHNAVINRMEDNTPIIFVVKDYVEEMPELLRQQAEQYRINMYMLRVDTFGTQIERQFRDLNVMSNYDEDYILKSLPETVKRGEMPFYYQQIKQAVFTPEEAYLIFDDEIMEQIRNVYIPMLEQDAKTRNDEVEVKNINDRIKRLRGNTCNYYVGGITAAETNEKYYRIEDAILAVRSAIKFGVVQGGGVTYYKIAQKLLAKENPSEGDIILANALKEPLKVMCRNAGKDFAGFEISLTNRSDMYFDFNLDEWLEISKSNIFDSAKTASTSLTNAVSIALQILQTNTIIFKR